jgi:hypothetical protein
VHVFALSFFLVSCSQKCDGAEVPCAVREKEGAARTVEFSRKLVGLYALQMMVNGVAAFEAPLQFRVAERNKANVGSKSPRLVHISPKNDETPKTDETPKHDEMPKKNETPKSDSIESARKSMAEQELEEVEKEIREMEIRRKSRMMEEQRMAEQIRNDQRLKEERELAEKLERDNLRSEAEATQLQLEKLKQVKKEKNKRKN